MAETDTAPVETFSFPQSQRARMHDVLLRLGRAAIRSQKITDHEAANDAQREALREIEVLVTEVLAARFEWADLCEPLRRSSIHSIMGGEPERYLIKIGCPDLSAMQTIRDGLVYLRENAALPYADEQVRRLPGEWAVGCVRELRKLAIQSRGRAEEADEIELLTGWFAQALATREAACG